MAGVLSRTLYRISSSLLPSQAFLLSKSSSPSSSLPCVLSPCVLSHRNRSNKSGKAQLVEVDLDSDGGGDVEVMSVRKLEDVIHSIIVRRSAPDWLPFIPGSSYWVPPRRRNSGVFEMVEKFSKPLSEESMSCTTDRGWPSSTYFIEGSAPMHPVPVEVHMEVEVEVQDNSEDDASESEDQES